MNYLFEWDQDKANTNWRKHRVRFDIATATFRDPSAITIFDEEHSDFEDRWITIGLVQNSQLLVVVHTFNFVNTDEAVIRIISARKATKNETIMYKGDL